MSIATLFGPELTNTTFHSGGYDGVTEVTIGCAATYNPFGKACGESGPVERTLETPLGLAVDLGMETN
jgi:hypothetical protein